MNSISGKFDQILLKIALNTNNRYILQLIIKKTSRWENEQLWLHMF